MITGVKAISIYDPATGTTVQLNNIVPGADAKIKRPIEILDVNNEMYYDGDESFLEFSSYTLDGYDQLESWMLAKTQLQLVVAGIDYNLFWYESAKITVYKNYGFATGSRNTLSVRISKRRGSHSIYAVTNMLRTNGKWEDANSNEKADMFTFSGEVGGTYIFSETSSPKYQQISSGSSGEIVSSIIIFPFSGLTIYGRSNAINYGGGGGLNFTFKIQAFDFSSSLLTESTVSDVDDVLSLLLPTNTYKIKWVYDIIANEGERFNLPFLGMQRGNYSGINF